MSLSPTELAGKSGISVPYASQVLRGKRIPSLTIALQIYDKTGLQFGFLRGLTTDEIEPLRRKVAA